MKSRTGLISQHNRRQYDANQNYQLETFDQRLDRLHDNLISELHKIKENTSLPSRISSLKKEIQRISQQSNLIQSRKSERHVVGRELKLKEATDEISFTPGKSRAKGVQVVKTIVKERKSAASSRTVSPKPVGSPGVREESSPIHQEKSFEIIELENKDPSDKLSMNNSPAHSITEPSSRRSEPFDSPVKSPILLPIIEALNAPSTNNSTPLSNHIKSSPSIRLSNNQLASSKHSLSKSPSLKTADSKGKSTEFKKSYSALRIPPTEAEMIASRSGDIGSQTNSVHFSPQPRTTSAQGETKASSIAKSHSGLLAAERHVQRMKSAQSLASSASPRPLTPKMKEKSESRELNKFSSKESVLQKSVSFSKAKLVVNKSHSIATTSKMSIQNEILKASPPPSPTRFANPLLEPAESTASISLPTATIASIYANRDAYLFRLIHSLNGTANDTFDLTQLLDTYVSSTNACIKELTVESITQFVRSIDTLLDDYIDLLIKEEFT